MDTSEEKFFKVGNIGGVNKGHAGTYPGVGCASNLRILKF